MSYQASERPGRCSVLWSVGAGYRGLPCEEPAPYACAHCGAPICTYHLRLGPGPGWPQLCPACWERTATVPIPARQAEPEPDGRGAERAGSLRDQLGALAGLLRWLWPRRGP